MIHRIYFFLLIVFITTGCGITSTMVSSIGAKAKWSRQESTNKDNIVSMSLLNSKMEISKNGDMPIYFPYKSLRPSKEGEFLDTIELKMSDIKWSSKNNTNKTGEISCFLSGEPILFEVNLYNDGKGNEFLSLISRYRSWYGYPAQCLMLVAVPADFVIGTLWFTGVAIITPIQLIIHN